MNKFGKEIRKDFPVFEKNADLAYLDNGATAQMPRVSMEKMQEFFENKANVHRGAYKLSDSATEKFEEARRIVADFIGANEDEVFFTSGTTLGLNSVCQMLTKDLKPGDNVVTTRLEHHANLIPWQQKAKEKGFELRFIDLNENLEIDLESAKKLIDENTKIVSFAHVSNVLGSVAPAKELIALAKNVGATTVVDGAQSVAYLKIDVKDLDCDFFVFSGHKIYGPTGIGAVYGKKEVLEKMQPIFFGGDMILKVSYEDSIWNEVPYKFEAGTPAIAEAVGLGAALKYLQEAGLKEVFEYEHNLCSYALERLKEVEGVQVYRGKQNAAPIISIVMDGIHTHDIASILDEHNVAVRAGHHCAMPLMGYLNIAGTTRMSFGLYNDKEDVDRAVEAIKKIQKLFV